MPTPDPHPTQDPRVHPTFIGDYTTQPGQQGIDPQTITNTLLATQLWYQWKLNQDATRRRQEELFAQMIMDNNPGYPRHRAIQKGKQFSDFHEQEKTAQQRRTEAGQRGMNTATGIFAAFCAAGAVFLIVAAINIAMIAIYDPNNNNNWHTPPILNPAIWFMIVFLPLCFVLPSTISDGLARNAGGYFGTQYPEGTKVVVLLHGTHRGGRVSGPPHYRGDLHANIPVTIAGHEHLIPTFDIPADTTNRKNFWP